MRSPPASVQPKTNTILVTCCGWAELLLRVVAQCPQPIARGIDTEERGLERARSNAEALGISVTMARSSRRARVFNPNPSPVPKHAPGDIPLDMQRAGAPHVYVNLTEFNGRFNFQLRYLSLKDDAVIAA